MRAERLRAACAAALMSFAASAADPPANQDDVAPRRAVNPEQREYQPGKLADDVFQASEELSPDHAIAFPVDF